MSAKRSLRIVSLEPSVTAILSALGRADWLVGVSKWCDQVAEVGDLPRVSTTWCAKAEEITALDPDLVIASVPYRTESVCELLQADLDVLCLYPQRLDDVFRHILTLGRLTDASRQAEQVVATMQGSFAALRARRRDLPRPRVYVEIWNDPLMCASPWVAELVDIAGGQPVPGGRSGRVSEQEILSADPQIIVVAWAGIPQPELHKVMQRPGWQQVEAIRTGRVLAVDEMAINAPGPNLVRGAELLLSCIHPELAVEHCS